MRNHLPKHVGLIMDGNGRWATMKDKPRTDGHLEGLETTKKIVRCASELGIQYLSLYVFSTENWKRTEAEIGFLMNLINIHLRSEYDFYRENGIRVVHSGDLEGLPLAVRSAIDGVQRDTQEFSNGLCVNLLINYGGKNEIIRAIYRMIESGQQITEEAMQEFLDRPELPPLDLIIRTAGEQRMSNFMTWQASYAELYFSQKLWPEFTEQDFIEAVDTYANRDRRFGGY